LPHLLGVPRDVLTRVAILRALKLGDLLCAVPAFRALRAALPRAHVTLVGLPWACAFVERFGHYFDDLLVLPGYPGFPEQPCAVDQIPDFLARAQARDFDLAIQMHGDGSVANPLAVMLGARHTAGFYRRGAYCPDPDRFLPYPDHLPEVWRHLRLMEHLGIPLQGDHLEFPVDDEDRRALGRLPEAGGLRPGEYVCIHPGASTPDHYWPAGRFAAVADRLAAEGLRVVLTGSAGEAPITRSVAQAMHAPSVDLAGQTDIGTLGALLSDARLLVSNDTGVAHIATALRVPSVVVSFDPEGPERWAPADRRRHRFLPGGAAVTVRQVLGEIPSAALGTTS
jgi:ADP-heptose:LPS heptosyltransferase